MYLTAKPPYVVPAPWALKGGSKPVSSSLGSVHSAPWIKKLFPVYKDLQELANMK